ncbi:arsenate reductase ArsC [Companilactobacillus kimchiensis]|uniref:Arsenate reductase n=1 Tax=Companilactobacillus kimchiensis TaxID=993692 RepID=A0A0R2L605_9LACO|nr:arsenate reductase ArsC [Companilactobacillus kimchiensis]KRN95349.1 arsenate reductase [Companilactobacillus kimchiensis]
MTNSIYFLSSSNSIRSQMAEGYAKKYLSNWDIQSAGVRKDQLDPLAVKIMAEDGVDISQQVSKVVDNDFLKHASLVVTLCGEARDKCLIPKNTRWLHWSLIDPIITTGNDTEVAATLRDVRNDIKQNILNLVAQINEQKK